MAIPVILKGETPKPIPLALKEGYDYSGCCLHVEFCGLQDTFINLEAGGRVDLRYTAEQTAVLPLGTSKVMLSLENANGEVRFMPWAKIKVTDSPADLYDGVITIDPATLDVDDLTAGDSLGTVKSRLNAVMAFLRALKVVALAALPFVACADVAPLYTTPNDMPGDAQLMTNTQAYVEAKMEEAGKVKSVNSKTGDVELVAADVSAVGISYVAPTFARGVDYEAGDVVEIGGKFYVFNTRWRKNWQSDPIAEECVDELTDFRNLGAALFAQTFLPLGDGGTNAPSYKKVNAGLGRSNYGYFILEPDGWEVETSSGEKAKLSNSILRYEVVGGGHWDVDIKKILTSDSTIPIESRYLDSAYEASPTSPYYVYIFLTNNYITAYQTDDKYLSKSDAASTYMTENAADGKYATPASVGSAIGSAIGSLRVEYVYNSLGNYRMNYDGQIQRQRHNSYNIDWTNETSGVVLKYSTPNRWRCEHPTYGEMWFTLSDGVIACDEIPFIRGEEDYPNAAVISITGLGVFRALPNAYGSLFWDDCKQLADAESVPNNITRTATDATLVHAGGGSTTNLIYIRQASSSLAGLMTAADKVKLDGVGNYATVSNRAMSAVQTESDPTISSWAKASSKPSYTASEVGATTVEDVYRIVAGTNVVLVVTNYNSATHAPAMKLQHLDPESGQYVTYWDEQRRHALTLTNAMDYADSQVATRAPKAWSRTTSGLGSEAPDGVTWISTPETVIAGGYEYEKVITSAGAVWVLSSNGLTTGATTNAFFRVTATDGTELFAIEKTDSFLIGVNPDGITRSGNTVTIPVNVVADAHPYIRATTNLVNAVWTKEDEDGFTCPWATVSWSGTTGAYVATVTCSEPQAFFYFEYLVEGGAKIKNSATVEMTGGIYFNGYRYMPVVNGSKLEFIRQ